METDRHEGGLEYVVREEVPAQVQEAVQHLHTALHRRPYTHEALRHAVPQKIAELEQHISKSAMDAQLKT